MNNTFLSLGQVARILSVKPYQIDYLLETGKVVEPARFCGRRMFSDKDVAAIAEVLAVSTVDEKKSNKGNE